MGGYDEHGRPRGRSDPEKKAVVRKLRERIAKETGEPGIAEGALLAMAWVDGDDSALADLERRTAP